MKRLPPEQAIERAEEAFWEELAKHFPDVTSGDLTPEELTLWKRATTRIVSVWLKLNRRPCKECGE